MAGTGASAAIGAAVGVSAMAVTAISTVAFAVTGISDKINKAAASVFGEDLVKIGNIFGAAYGAFGGGFAGPAADSGASIGAANSLSDASYAGADWAGAGLDAGTTAATGADAMNLSDMAGLDGLGSYNSAEQLAGDADAIRSMGGDVPDFSAATDPRILANSTQQSTDLIQGPAMSGPQAAQTPTSPSMTGAASPGASAPSAAQATAPQASAAQAAASPAATAATAPPAGQRSFFDRLVYDKSGNVTPAALRMGGQILSGVGQGYSAAMTAKQKQAQFDAQMRMMNQRPGLVVTQ